MRTDYSVIRKIGHGGFGNVFLVKNARNEDQVIKSIPLKEFSKYVINEFEILKNLKHPRIIKFIDFFPSHDCYNLVMEYAEQGSLRSMIFKFQENRWKMSNSDLILIFMDILYGVRYLHSKNIIHRDIKPENILLTSDYRAKIADFGVSKIVNHCCPEVHTSIGTLSYMSPEVYLHKPYDKSCDIWALGLILYEMAMMKYPFDKVDKSRILNPLLTFECPKVDWKSRKYNPNLQQVLESMIQRDPRKRRDINSICSHPSFETTFSDLEKEYAAYLAISRKNNK